MLSRLVCSKNNLFFAFIMAGYIFGVILYDFFEFKYTDELMVLFLCTFAGIMRKMTYGSTCRKLSGC